MQHQFPQTRPPPLREAVLDVTEKLDVLVSGKRPMKEILKVVFHRQNDSSEVHGFVAAEEIGRVRLLVHVDHLQRPARKVKEEGRRVCQIYNIYFILLIYILYY